MSLTQARSNVVRLVAEAKFGPGSLATPKVRAICPEARARPRCRRRPHERAASVVRRSTFVESEFDVGGRRGEAHARDAAGGHGRPVGCALRGTAPEDTRLGADESAYP